MHPSDVARYGLHDGGWAKVSSRRGAVEVRVQTTRRSPQGTVFASFAFADVPINALTGSGLRSNYTNGRVEGLSGTSGTYCGENTVGRGLSHWEVGR